MSDSREYDVIIWGASSFTGRLVAEFYLNTYGLDGELKWAMAGRNQAKLEEVRAELGNTDVPILIGNSHDAASLKELVSKTKVICTTVGPYALYGSELVAACVEAGTDYCDLAGETQWIRRMIDQHHER
ncbi:saccharopine dehydrogenase NADP-binding domain-containing protein, partial [Oleiphilus sp. HI0079]